MLYFGVYGCVHAVAVDMDSPAEVSTEGRTTLSQQRRQNRWTGAQSDLSQANLAWSAIRFAVLSDYTLRTGQRERRTIPKIFLLGLLGNSLCPKGRNNSEKAHIECGSIHCVTSSAHGTRNPSNVKPTKCLSWQILQILCLPIFTAIR